MIGVDSNVLLRDATGDDPEQAAKAARFLDERSAADPAFVSVVVLIETTWTLARTYRRSPTEIATYVRRLLGAKEIVVQASAAVRRALDDVEGTRADLSDAIIAHLAVDADCDYTVTFDRRAAELPGMLLLE